MVYALDYQSHGCSFNPPPLLSFGRDFKQSFHLHYERYVGGMLNPSSLTHCTLKIAVNDSALETRIMLI